MTKHRKSTSKRKQRQRQKKYKRKMELLYSPPSPNCRQENHSPSTTSSVCTCIVGDADPSASSTALDVGKNLTSSPLPPQSEQFLFNSGTELSTQNNTFVHQSSQPCNSQALENEDDELPLEINLGKPELEVLNGKYKKLKMYAFEQVEVINVLKREVKFHRTELKNTILECNRKIKSIRSFWRDMIYFEHTRSGTIVKNAVHGKVIFILHLYSKDLYYSFFLYDAVSVTYYYLSSTTFQCNNDHWKHITLINI